MAPFGYVHFSILHTDIVSYFKIPHAYIKTVTTERCNSLMLTLIIPWEKTTSIIQWQIIPWEMSTLIIQSHKPMENVYLNTKS
jgi:hypothetical protein